MILPTITRAGKGGFYKPRFYPALSRLSITYGWLVEKQIVLITNCNESPASETTRNLVYVFQ